MGTQDNHKNKNKNKKSKRDEKEAEAEAEASQSESESEEVSVSFSSSDFEVESDGEEEEEEENKGGSSSKVKDPEDEQDVETSFEFFDPSEGDFLGMKGLLNAYLDGTVYDCSGLVDHVIKQKTVGSVVRLEEQLDPIAVVSVINMHKHQHAQCLVDILNFIREGAKKEEDKNKLEQVLRDPKGRALVVSERVVNCPLELSSPLQQAIFDEIDWATEDEPTQELRDSFKFSHFLLFTRVYYTSHAAGGGGGGNGSGSGKGKKKMKKRQKTEKEELNPEDLVFIRPEDQFFYNECSWHFTFPASHAHDMDGMSQHRLVMWIDKKSVRKARKELDKLFGNYLPPSE